MTANARRGLSVTVLATALLAAACVTATKNVETRVVNVAEDRSVVEPGDAITIIPEEGIECISESLRQVHSGLRIVPPDEFRRVAFPDEPPDRIPFTYPIPEALRQRLTAQDFRDRVAPLKLRYLVSIGEVESVGNMKVGGLFLVGGGTWTKYLTLMASIIDLKDAREAGRIVVDAQAEERMGFIFLLPALHIETTHEPACKSLGEALASFLKGPGKFPYAGERAPEPGR